MVNDEEAYDVPDENKELLIEILSCRDLPSGSKSNHLSDPYVEINLGNSNLHQTDVIKKTLNPIYSSEDRNSYILNTPARELWTKGGIELKVKEYIRGIGKDRVLGSAMVSANKLYNAPEGKMEIPLDTSGFVTIQIRKATLGDKEDAILGKTLFKMFSNINPLKKDTKVS
jgi:Ca2+-dependent lipid-binding protein